MIASPGGGAICLETFGRTRVAAAAVRQHDRADHRHQQDQPGDLEGEQVAGVEQLPERDDVRAPPRPGSAPRKRRPRLAAR